MFCRNPNMIDVACHITLENTSTTDRGHNCNGTHHRDNHAGNKTIEEVINVVRMWVA